MKMKRIIAKSMPEALQEVRRSLGADAVIISNKKLSASEGGGIEVMAALDYDEELALAEAGASNRASDQAEANRRRLADSLAGGDSPSTKQSAGRVNAYAAVGASSDSKAAAGQHELKAFTDALKTAKRDQSGQTLSDLLQEDDVRFGGQQEQAYKTRLVEETKTPELPKQKAKSKDVEWVKDPQLQSMEEALSNMQALLEYQMSGLAWQDRKRRKPMEVTLLKRLVGIGIHADLASVLVARVDGESHTDLAWQKCLEMLSSSIKTEASGLIDRGGVYVLVGATGVGKTTTLAKLAAQYALCYGPDGVAMISADTYRIAAHEQLRIYGRILGVPVALVDDAKGLADALEDFSDRKLVLVDTAGMGQRDERLSEQFEVIKSGAPNAEHYIALSAAVQPWVLEESIDRFKALNLKGAVLSKLDEASSLGECISVLIERELPLAYMTTGQCVPEDICRGDPRYLINVALNMAERQCHHVGDEKMAAIFNRSAFDGAGSL